MEVQTKSEDMATVYGGTDAPLDTAVATSGRSPYTTTASGENDERHHLPSTVNSRLADTSLLRTPRYYGQQQNPRRKLQTFD